MLPRLVILSGVRVGASLCVCAQANSEACTDGELPSKFPSMFDLAEIIRQHEGKTLEFKRDLSSPDKVMRTLVAFANGAGGRLLVGVENGSREIIGVPDTANTEEQLANFIADRIEPKLVPENPCHPLAKESTIAGGRSFSKPKPAALRLQGAGVSDGVYVRVRSTNRQADAAAVAELQRVVQRTPPLTKNRSRIELGSDRLPSRFQVPSRRFAN